MKKRIIGIDVARALAVFGMIIVNFKMVFGKEGESVLGPLASVFDGKAAATFVVLAGVGLAFMTNSAIRTNNVLKLKQSKKKIVKRALFLFVLGTSYLFIWPADILHFYGIYMLLTLLLIDKSTKVILYAAFSLIFLYPFLMYYFSYDQGWNFNSFEYSGFWTIEGFTRNLFYNGFHPVLPWAAFMLIGLWFGKQDLNDDRFLKRVLLRSLIVFVAIFSVSQLAITLLSEGSETAAEELAQILGTSPMPPLPIYMISGSSVALFMISVCILLAKRFQESSIIKALSKTGQLALTFYVAHVILGMGLMEEFGSLPLGKYSLNFSLSYAVLFSLTCVLFAMIWLRFKGIGPLEWVMRKVTS